MLLLLETMKFLIYTQNLNENITLSRVIIPVASGGDLAPSLGGIFRGPKFLITFLVIDQVFLIFRILTVLNVT